MSIKFLIYGLIDPRTQQLRYVGKSCSGLKRPRQHRSPGGIKRATGHAGSWLRSLFAAGLRPEFCVLEEHGNSEDLLESEVFWIGYFKMIGANLTNMQAGGDGRHHGMKMSNESRKNSSVGAYRRWGDRPPLDETLIVEKYKAGLSTYKVAKLYNTSSSHVFGVLKRNGCRLRSKSEARKL